MCLVKNTMNNKKIVTAVAMGIVLATPLIALAQPTTVVGVVGLFSKALGIIQTVFFIVAAILLIYAAFLYLTSGGDEEKVKKAKSSLIYAIIAIAVALLALVIPQIIANFTGGTAPTVTPGTY